TIKSSISAYMADRFGHYNVLEGQSVSFYSEAGAIERQGVTTTTVTAAAGIAQSDLRTQNPMPQDVARGLAGDSISNAYFGGANEPWYTSGGVTYNPRDGWATVLATTQGEEGFFDDNVDGLFTRSYATSICPFGAICECDGGVTNGYASSVSGGAVCAVGKRSEGFVDLGEPFYDVNDDGVRNDGLTSGKPFQYIFDSNRNGPNNTPNSMWDGPDCQSPPTCEQTKTIWDDLRIVFSGSPVFYPLPDAFNCYNCNAFAAGSFAAAPASITKGSSGTFTVIVGDRNLNKLEGGTTIAVTATKGTVSPATIPDISDSESNPSTGPSVIGFNVEIAATETATQTTVAVEVATPRGIWSIITVVPII
ncbi:MAG: hypothetical protein Q7T53_02290, partial [Deltaproteobacteria bacterium]|nr:hypothetical protein [Deltaproteobacteria bacterium]